MKCLFNKVSFVLAIALGLSFLALPAAAQDQGYFTYVSVWAVPRSNWAAFEKQEQASIPAQQKLISDGTLVDWGNAAARVHQEDGYTHAEWFTANSRAGLLKALEIQWTGATNAAFVGTTKHYDLFLHTMAHGGKTSSGATGYIRVASWKAKPGQEEAFEAHVMKYIKPMLDAGVENGTILMYNFDKEDIHTDEPGFYNLAVVYPNGEALDKFFTDLTAADKENPAIGQVVDSLTVAERHRDSFSRVTAFQHK
jgi:hypothetical protein